MRWLTAFACLLLEPNVFGAAVDATTGQDLLCEYHKRRLLKDCGIHVGTVSCSGSQFIERAQLTDADKLAGRLLDTGGLFMDQCLSLRTTV